MVEGVKRGERNGEWEVRKDGRKIVRAEVRTGDDVVSMMFWGLRKKTQNKREKREVCSGKGATEMLHLDRLETKLTVM